MDKKRKRDISEKRIVKRFQPELFDSEDEEEMCRIADEVEMWGEDDNLEELMAQTVDSYEELMSQAVENKEHAKEVNQYGQGKPLSRNAHRTASDNPQHTVGQTQRMDDQQQGMDGQQQRYDGQQQGVDGAPRERDGLQQVMDGQQPAMHGLQQGMDGPRRRMDVQQPGMDQPRQGIDGPQQRIDGQRQGIDGQRQGSDAIRQEGDAPQQGRDGQQPEANTALNGTVIVLPFTPANNTDILGAFRELEPRLVQSLQNLLQQHGNTRGYITLNATYTRVNNGQVLQHQQVFRTRNVVFSSANDIDDYLPEMMREIFERSQEFEAQGSGWTLELINGIEIHAAKYAPLQGSSYIKIPREIETTRSVLNIKNQDEKCAVWSILAFLHPVGFRDHPQLVNKYTEYEHELNLQGIKFPTPLKDIKKIEQQNNLSINVFGYDRTEKVYPLYITRDLKENRHVNLLLIAEGEKRHYCLIRNFSRLMSYRTKYNGQQHFCFNCLHSFCRKELLDKHKQLCLKQQTQVTSFPEKDVDKVVTFKSTQKQLPVPFVIYADFESYTEKIDHCKPDPSKSGTTPYQKHVPSGFCYMVVSTAPEHTKQPVVYRGENVIETFFERLFDEHTSINNILKVVQPMNITEEEQERHLQATICYICDKPFGAERPVRDHDHLTGKYRGAAHSECNLAYKYKLVRNNREDPVYKVPVIFHNLRGYDGHMLMSALGKYKTKRIECIANNSERYVTFSLNGLQFIDSFQFMSTSLDKLIGNLNKEEFKFLHTFIESDRQRQLLLRKGVYPYDYVDSPDRLKETELPNKENFYSKLNDEHINDEDYNHAQDVWNEFNCQTLGDYHDVYMASDVLLLGDVFESFRKTAFETYKLDPAHYFTAPGLSWDAMLKLTQVELQLIDDPDMYLMIESGLRGGVSVITKKHAVANNPLIEGYDNSKPTNYLMYLDANNLYGWAMSQKLPEKEFDWMTEHQLENFDVTMVSDDSETGYILEVDLHYPPEIHDDHNDLPLAPESMEVSEDDLSPYTQSLREKLNIRGQAYKKLTPNLHDKKRYVVHYRNLKLYLSLGLKLVKIHRGIEFHQSFWLRKYISMNTEKRKMARNSFEKDFYKLMNNSVFGKTMENVRGRKNIELVHTERRMKKIAAKPSFTAFTIFNPDLVAAHCVKSTILLNKPIFVGFAILDLSKVLMYDFHYGYINNKYGQDAQLCFTDTDSLMYDVKCEDIYKDMHEDSEMFDFSDYPQEHPLFNDNNKKVLGKMKDETAGTPIEEFVGLRSKMYSLRVGGKEKKTAKGIKKTVIKKNISHAAYRDVLLNEEITTATMNLIRSYRHQVFSITSQKLALSSYDDKRYVLEDKFTTRAHGHYLNHLETVQDVDFV